VLEFFLERFFAVVKRGHGRSGLALPAVYSGAAALFPPRTPGAKVAGPQEEETTVCRCKTSANGSAAPGPWRISPHHFRCAPPRAEAAAEPEGGDPLPPLWHWLYFLEAAPMSKVGADGHAERGDFLPPVSLPRRMWAGSRFAFEGEPLCVGDTIHRLSRIKSV